MSIEQSREEVRGARVLGWRLILFILKTGGDLELMHMLFPPYFAMSLGKRRAWNSALISYRSSTESLIFQVKNLQFRTGNCLPCWLVTKPELALRPGTLSQGLVPLIYLEPRNLSLNKGLFGKDYDFFRELFPLITLSLRICVTKTWLSGQKL